MKLHSRFLRLPFQLWCIKVTFNSIEFYRPWYSMLMSAIFLAKRLLDVFQTRLFYLAEQILLPNPFLSVRNFINDLDRTFFAYFSFWNVYEFSEQKIAYLHNFLHFPFACLKELQFKNIINDIFPRHTYVRMNIIPFNKDPKFSFEVKYIQSFSTFPFRQRLKGATKENYQRYQKLYIQDTNT